MSEKDEGAARILTEAAKHIERVGLNQDGDYYSRDDTKTGIAVTESRCCALGALTLVGNGLVGDTWPLPYGASTVARHTLAETVEADYMGESVASWNDQPTTTKDDVVAVMRKAAQKLEQGA